MTRARVGSWWESPDPRNLYDFAPLLPDGSGKRQLMMINEVDLAKLKFGRSSKPTTVYDLLTKQTYTVQGNGNDSRLVAE